MISAAFPRAHGRPVIAQRIVSAVSRVHIVPMQMRAQLGRGNEAM